MRNHTAEAAITRALAGAGQIIGITAEAGLGKSRLSAEIIRLACLYLKPRLIHIPTNAISPKFIAKTTRKILGYMDELAPASVPISIKPSIDGVGAEPGLQLVAIASAPPMSAAAPSVVCRRAR